MGHTWGGVPELNKQAEVLAHSVYQRVSETADLYRCDALLVLKNLVAESSLSDLARIRSLLIFWKPNFEENAAQQARRLVSVLDSYKAGSCDFFRWALLGGRKPSVSTAADFFRYNLALIIAYHREVLLGGLNASQDQASRLISFLARRQEIQPSELTREILLNEGFAKYLPPLEQAQLKKLPQETRRWFLRDAKLRSATCVPSYLAEINGSPLNFPDTPEALDHKLLHEVILPKALRDFASHSFHSQHIQELLQRPELELFSKQILDAIRLPRQVASTDVRAVLPLPRNIAINSDKNLKNTLLFFSKQLFSRLEWLMSLPTLEIQQLEPNIPKEDLQAALTACSSRPTLKKCRKVFTTAAPSEHELLRLLKSKTSSREFEESFACDLFSSGQTDEMFSLFSNKPYCLAVANPTCLTVKAFQQFVLKCCSNSALLERFIENVSSALLKTLLGGKGEIFERCKGAICATLADRGAASLRQSLRRSMIELLPNSIGNFVGWEISKKDFAELIGIRMKMKHRGPAAALLHFVFKDGAPVWEFFLNDRKRNRFLKPLIREHRPDLTNRLNQLEAASLLQNSEFREKLLNHLSVSSHTPLGLSMGVRWELIAWIREKFESKPTLSIAYQLALAFSIKDTSYLRKLCFERWASPLRKNPGHVFNPLYSLHRIPKKSGGCREIHVPCAELKRLQSRILRNGFDRVAMSRSAHGFHRKRSILTNASPHSGKPCVVNVDINAFFQTTGHNLILQSTAQLANRHLSYGARQALADILSHDGVLPTGAPTSPAIGNLVLRAADAAISKVAGRHGIDYTRYADDLTFSGHRHTVKILPFVEKVLGQLGYKLNRKKTNVYRRGRRQMVTGLVVNEKPNLPRSIRRRLRAAVHSATKGDAPHWNGRPMNRNELAGRIALLNLVDKEKAAKLHAKLVASKPSV